MCTLPYSLFPNGWQNRILFFLHQSLHSWGLQLPSPPLRFKSFDWVISSDLLRLSDPDTHTLLYRSSGSRFSTDISFAPSSLALFCSWEVLQDLDFDHLPILLPVSLSPFFRRNERPPSFNFQKARWDDFASYFDSHSTLSLSSAAAALFTSLALNAAKSPIPFDRIKRPPKTWGPAEVEGAVSERRKAFAAAHRSDEDHQAYISACRRASSVIAKAKAEAWYTICSSLSPKSNAKSVHSLLRSIFFLGITFDRTQSSSHVSGPYAVSLLPHEALLRSPSLSV